MDISSKFNLGDTVRVKTYKEQTMRFLCPFCVGKGFLTFRDKDLPCGSCHGTGTYHDQRRYSIWSREKRVAGLVSLPSKGLQIVVIDEKEELSFHPEKEVILADETVEGAPCLI